MEDDEEEDIVPIGATRRLLGCWAVVVVNAMTVGTGTPSCKKSDSSSMVRTDAAAGAVIRRLVVIVLGVRLFPLLTFITIFCCCTVCM